MFSLAAALAIVPVAQGQAAPPSDFTFFGSGFGHGVGMSQWGAYGLALKGWTHEQILTHYFSDTTVAKNASGPDKIRVGLVDGVQFVHVAAVGGPVALQTGTGGGDGTVVATVPGGKTYLVKGGTGSWKIMDDQGAQVGSTIDGSKKLYANYLSSNSKMRSAEAGHTYNRGYVELNDYRPCDGCDPRVRMIAVVPTQQYLYGLGEVPASWPAEAQQAQADAARSYAEFLIAALGQNRTGCNCGLYDDTRNQVYAAWDHEGEQGGAQWVKAVDDTDGEVVLYQGKVIDAQYTSSSGGFTENNENVWGGSPVPYLRGVCDPGDYNDSNPARVWKVTLTAAAVTSKLRPYTGDIGTVQGFGQIVRGISGRIRSLSVKGADGSKTIAGSTVRGALGLMDDRVWINNDKNVTGTIRGKYDSLSCAPGLPKSPEVEVTGGSRQRFTNGAIYRNASANRVVWLFGDVYAEYRHANEGNGPLGLPVSRINTLGNPAGCDQQVCQKAKFDKGFVYFKADTGAHELHGAVLDYFVSQDGVLGHLGFPTTDVVIRKNGAAEATFQGHPGGSPITVSCPKNAACSEFTGS